MYFIIDFSSSVGPEFAQAKAIFFLVVAVILFIVGAIIAYFTFSYGNTNRVYLISNIGNYSNLMFEI
jgi:hypothetical protein